MPLPAQAVLAGIKEAADAVREGIRDTADFEIDTSGSRALQYAIYNALDKELRVQFRNRRRFEYFYPMNPLQVAQWQAANSMGNALPRFSRRRRQQRR